MNQIYCSNCGQLIPLNSNFCRFCGAAQHGQEASLYRAQEAPVPPGEIPAPPEQQPTKDSIPKSHLNGNVIWIFVANYLKVTSIMIPLLLVGLYFQPIYFGIAILGVLSVLIFIALLAYNNFTYEVTEDGLFIEFGIVHKKTITVPFSQVQNVNIERSLIDRFLGLARISIETAGSAITQPMQVIGGYTAKSEAYIPGVTLNEAKKLHDILIDGKLDGEY